MRIIKFDTELKRLDAVEVLDERGIPYQLVEHGDASFPDVFTTGTYKIALTAENYERLVRITEVDYPFQDFNMTEKSSGSVALLLIAFAVLFMLGLLIYGFTSGAM